MSRIYMDSNIVIGDPKSPIPNCPLDLLQQEIRFFGANLSPTLDPDVSHVLVHTRYIEWLLVIIDKVIFQHTFL